MPGLFDNWPKFDIGEGAFYAVFGFVFVFIGIALLILIFSLIGWINKKINEREKGKSDANKVKDDSARLLQSSQDDAISPEIVAVITAAIAAYYDGEKSQCDFVVKRIKRL